MGRILPRRTAHSRMGTKLYPGSRRRKRARPERGQQADALMPASASTHARGAVSRGVRVKRRWFLLLRPVISLCTALPMRPMTN